MPSLPASGDEEAARPGLGPYTETVGTLTWSYAAGYTVTISPAATAGPVYWSSDWTPSTSLGATSATGIGLIEAQPGTYALSATGCSSTPTTVVAGYVRTYVGVSCTPPDGGAGSSDASADSETGG